MYNKYIDLSRFSVVPNCKQVIPYVTQWALKHELASEASIQRNEVKRQIFLTFMATGYIKPPTSKLPFLNIIIDVLFIQVPEIQIKK